ncbi:collagen-like protein [Conexibacter woesei]|uniref:Collagen triple helix repeat protein n=1 Tax=Conexibacter woesei (strain DSM 14684 / CCUG 47730 / CIP 108061 / JCM 11494 / NBRC 100937 / ID131577) TaxID=469383 RepID=D3FEK0_CONWI|nr:collagen-like protein [Conexibacter woesei]ADB49674.1 Collagen triple helix repeat protein [Conexibacter woesei DSM 14684]
MSKVLTLLRRHAVAFAALFLLMGGTAYAVADQATSSAAPKAKTLYACVAGGYDTLNLTTAERTCPNGQRKISWNAEGKRGARGPAGSAGQAGAAGARGAAGPAGPAGPTGPAGSKGDAGPKGEAGARGPQGETGPAGARGADGATGPQGPDGRAGLAGATGATGPAGTSEFAQFFALMPPDNAATVAPGTDVAFPQDGPSSSGIARTGPSAFNLAEVGTYRVAFNVPVTEAGQLILTLDGADLAYTVTGRATGTSQITGEAFVQTTVPNSILTVRNPAGNPTALTITPLAGGTRPVSATLIVEQLTRGP